MDIERCRIFQRFLWKKSIGYVYASCLKYRFNEKSIAARNNKKRG